MLSRRIVVRASLGNLAEWFDWFVYAWFAIYFAGAFFPAHDATAQLLSTAVVFAIGFLMRPLGGWVLGLYADRRGRRAALTLSVSLMSVGSLAVAFNPGYEAIGIAAPVLLVVARITQGLSLGGEFGTSASYLTEVADPRRNFFASLGMTAIIREHPRGFAVAFGLAVGGAWCSTPTPATWSATSSARGASTRTTSPSSPSRRWSCSW